MLEDYLQEIQAIIRRYLPDETYAIYLFGSRVTKPENPHADIDIGIEGLTTVDRSIMSKIRNDIEDSNIPCLVDIVDFQDADDDFLAVAKKTCKRL